MEHYKDTDLLMPADHVDAENTEPEENNEETQLPNDEMLTRWLDYHGSDRTGENCID